MKEQDYKAILDKLTLEEKAALCSGLTFWTTTPIARVGIPSVRMTDGPHGLRSEMEGTTGTNVMKQSHPATCFPPAVTSGSSWDPDLLEKVGEAIATEAKALGVSTVLGPGVNIKRSPLCGRNFEYFSEDPYVAGIMGAALVHGIQKKGVGTSLKHFCANNQERLRMSIDTIVDERALREIYLPAFEHIVKTEQPTTVMCSYNRLAGTYLSDNKRMLTDILRDEWGFKGIVVSDWGAVNDRIAGVKAGMDLEMPGNRGANDKNIVKAVKDGVVSEEELDRVVLRLIKFAFDCKAGEDKSVRPDFKAHNALAVRMAESGAVLLKNIDNTLPLSSSQKVAVIGALAKKPRYQGSGSSLINPTMTTSFLQAMDAAKQPYEYADGYKLKGNGYSARLIAEAVETAKRKDAVIVFIGLTPEYESEGFDRKHINMPDAHIQLVKEIAKVNRNIVVVLSCGSPVALDDVEENSKAILNLYLGGQSSGSAAYNLLYGKANPSGKLTETFPFANGDNIVARYFPMGPRSVQYRESIYVGYRYYEAAKKPVRYPFGYGLSYTEFAYSDLKLSADAINEGDDLTVTFKVKNIGKVDGAEVAQLYVADVQSSIFRPVKELKGFKKVFLKAGEEKEVTLTLDRRAFAYYNVLIKDWHIESGEFRIMVGASSADIRLEASVTVTSANPSAPIPDYRATAPIYYNLTEDSEQKRTIPIEQFAALYGASVVDNVPYAKGEFDINCSIGDVSVSGVGKALQNLITFGVSLIAGSSANREMLIRSAVDMPLRAFMGFTGGVLSMASVRGLVDMCNGKKGGFGNFCRGFKKDDELEAYILDVKKSKPQKED